jgi:hypothetical protein
VYALDAVPLHVVHCGVRMRPRAVIARTNHGLKRALAVGDGNGKSVRVGASGGVGESWVVEGHLDYSEHQSLAQRFRYPKYHLRLPLFSDHS